VQTVKLNQAASIVRVLVLPMAWWFLASRAVYGEPIAGDRQFWVTKPYRWTSLLGAKLLFMLTFVSLPLVLADCFILLRQGFQPRSNPAGLLWHEGVIFAVLLLPMMAAASITTSLARVASVGLATLVPILVLQRILSPNLDVWFQFGVSEGWIEISLLELVLISAALAIMILQYHARRTRVSRIIFACAAAVMVLLGGRILPRSTSWALQSRFLRPRIDTSTLTGAFSPEAGPPHPSPTVPEGMVRLGLPVRYYGLPSGTLAETDVMRAELTLPRNHPLGRWLWFGGSRPHSVWHFTLVERSLFERLKGTPVQIHLNVYLTVLGNPHAGDVPLEGGPYRVPGVGLCECGPRWRGWTAVSCWAPFRPPAYVVGRFIGINKKPLWEQRSIFYSPLPADIGINPISGDVWTVPEGATTMTITTWQPLAHIRRQIDIPNVQLAEFVY
jgi:hypothetical protein